MRKILWIVIPAVVLVGGCQWDRPSQLDEKYRTVAADPRRDTERARAENARGKSLLTAGRLEEAEKALRSALAADLFYGPAHNNLGSVYYKQKKFYFAAWEYQYAAKLMPGRPEPRNNLGMVMESVGRLKDASKHYEEALAAAPDSVESIGNLARCRIRLGQRDERTKDLLKQIELKDTRPEWVEWARMALVKMRSRPPSPAVQPTTRPAEGSGI